MTRDRILQRAYWNMITDFTGGDMSMLPKLIELGQFQTQNRAGKKNKVLPMAMLSSIGRLFFQI